MRPQTHFDTKPTKGDLAADRHKMGLDKESESFLVKLLTDLYTDPIGAVVREYSVNARDSVVDAGNSEPIEVSLPSQLDGQEFRVTDYGQGLSETEVCELFGLYGKSTKRGSDDVTGMLGVGCKSGLTYATAFTVESVKDGQRTVVHFTRDEDDLPSYAVIDSGKSAERNHTTVSVPVGRWDIDTFREYAKWFFGFWQPGTVLVDGVAPTPVWMSKSYTRVGTTDCYVGPQGSDKVVVMGNVPYKVDHDVVNSVLGYSGMVLFVPMGAVSFAPSREELTYNKATLRALKVAMDELEKHSQTVVSEALSKATTLKEAFDIRIRFQEHTVFTKNVRWEWVNKAGKTKRVPKPPSRLNVDRDKARQMEYKDSNGQGFSTHGRVSAGTWTGGGAFIVVNNFRAKSVAKHYKEGIGTLLDNGTIEAPIMTQKGWNGSEWQQTSVIVFTGDITKETDFDGNSYDYLPIVEWDAIKDKMPKPNAKSSNPGMVVDRQSHNLQKIAVDRYSKWVYRSSYAPEIAKGYKDAVFYIVDARPTDSQITNVRQLEALENVYPVIVYAKARDEFRKTYKTIDSQGIQDALNELVKDVSDFAWATYNGCANGNGGFWDIGKGQDLEILDPDVAAGIENVKAVIGEYQILDSIPEDVRRRMEMVRNQRNRQYRSIADRQKSLTQVLGSATLVKEVEKRYPLADLGYYGHYNKTSYSQTVDYINALYTYRQEGN